MFAKEIASIPYLVSIRYDRYVSSDGWIERLHQEDFCQILGKPSYQKYEKEGGPGIFELFSASRKFLSLNEINQILLWLLFNVFIGNCDAHAKNISIFYGQDGNIHLAPFYDLVSTVAYPSLSSEFSMNFGNARKVQDIGVETLSQFSKATGIGVPYISKTAQNLLEKISLNVSQIERQMKKEGWSCVETWSVGNNVLRNCKEVGERLNFAT
jgi:serine/threonine-protein kinase HipA